MERPNINLVLLVVVSLIITLYGPSMVQAEEPNDDNTPTPTTSTGDVNQCSPIQRRQDLLDTRLKGRETRLNGLDTKFNELHSQLNGLDTRLSTQLNSLDTRLTTQLNKQQNDVDTRLNRMDDRLDGIQTAISDMKTYVQNHMEAMETKMEWALSDIKQKGVTSTPQPITMPQVSILQPDTTPQQNVTKVPAPQGECAVLPDGARSECGYSGITEQECVRGRSCCYDASKPNIPHCYFKGYKGCQDALGHGQNTSGVYTIVPKQGTSMDVYCEQRLDGGGWTVFQSRKDGSVDFYRDWHTYKAGFGQLSGEFWLGNAKIYNLTKHHDMKLKVELTTPEGEVKFADYDHFWIDDEAHKYKLTVTGYTGSSPPGDALTYHNGQLFSTTDRDNDPAPQHCANTYKGGWWYNQCHYSNLNGLYDSQDSKGMSWYQWKRYAVSMKATRMMFRKRP